MKLIVKTGALIRTLNEAIDAIPSASPDPSYRNFLFTVTANELNVLASDGNVTLKTTLPAKEDETVNILEAEPGQVQISAHFLVDIVRKLEGDTVTLQTADTSLLTLSDNRTFYKVNTLDAADYPDVDIRMDESTAVSVPHADFVKLFNATAFAAATKSTKICYTGIKIFTRNDHLIFRATDVRRMAQYSVPMSGVTDLDFIVAVKVLGLVARREDVKDVEFQQDGSKAIFKVGSTLIQSRLFNGEFPDLDRVTPKETPYVLTVNANEFLDALDRVTTVTQGAAAPVVTLRCSQDLCELVANSSIYGDAKETLSDFTFTGDIFNISFTPKYVSEAIKAQGTDKVTLAFAGTAKLFLIKSDDPANIQIVTPIRS